MSNSFYTRLTRIVEDNIGDQDFGVTQLASEIGYSRSQLHKKLKSHTGQSASQFIREIRLQRACELLKDSNIAISEVAYEVGFNSPSYFNKCFNDLYGFPPGKLQGFYLDNSPVQFPESQSVDEEIKRSSNSKPGEILLVKRGLLVITVTVLLFMAYYFFQTRNSHTSHETSLKSLAVLPLTLENADVEKEYLLFGLGQGIIDELVGIVDLPIVSLISAHQDSVMIQLDQVDHKELGAYDFLKCSLADQGRTLTLSAQLIDGSSKKELWSKRFEVDQEGLLDMQYNVAYQIALALKADFKSNPLQKNLESSSNKNMAYQLYLRAKYAYYQHFQSTWRKEDFKLAEDLYIQALEIDPKFGLAHAGLADLYNSYRKAFAPHNGNPENDHYKNLQKKEIALAYHLDYQSDYVNQVKGWVHLEFSEFQEAYDSFKRAVELNPSSSWNLIALVSFLNAQGLYDESLELINLTIDVDPLNSHAFVFRGVNYMQSGRYDLALSDLNQALKINPKNLNALYFLSTLYELRGEEELALQAWEQMNAFNPDIKSIVNAKRDIQAPGHRENKLVAISADYVLANLLLGNTDKALEAMAQDHTLFNYYILNNLPLFDAIRDTPIFEQQLLEKKHEYDSLKRIYGVSNLLNNLQLM
jgi:AraC-like DNA-binding protein/tetratricopeptide (TPR) repeat protein